jgi:hypothetical protein
MGQVRKDEVKDYWSPDSTITTPIFSQTMSQNHYKAKWQALYFSNNSQMKMIPVDSSE